jgi:hypothetical protein
MVRSVDEQTLPTDMILSQLNQTRVKQVLQPRETPLMREINLNYGGSGDKEPKEVKFAKSSYSNPMFSLRHIAEERLIQFKKTDDPLIQNGQFFKSLFANSLILDSEEKKILYMNLPFDLKDPPVLNLIWYRPDATTDGPEVQELFFKKQNQYPNLVLFMHNGQKFGGYASHPWTNKKAT